MFHPKTLRLLLPGLYLRADLPRQEGEMPAIERTKSLFSVQQSCQWKSRRPRSPALTRSIHALTSASECESWPRCAGEGSLRKCQHLEMQNLRPDRNLSHAVRPARPGEGLTPL